MRQHGDRPPLVGERGAAGRDACARRLRCAASSRGSSRRRTRPPRSRSPRRAPTRCRASLPFSTTMKRSPSHRGAARCAVCGSCRYWIDDEPRAELAHVVLVDLRRAARRGQRDRVGSSGGVPKIRRWMQDLLGRARDVARTDRRCPCFSLKRRTNSAPLRYGKSSDSWMTIGAVANTGIALWRSRIILANAVPRRRADAPRCCSGRRA